MCASCVRGVSVFFYTKKSGKNAKNSQSKLGEVERQRIWAPRLKLSTWKQNHIMHSKAMEECRNHSENLINRKRTIFCIESISQKKSQLRNKIYFFRDLMFFQKISKNFKPFSKHGKKHNTFVVFDLEALGLLGRFQMCFYRVYMICGYDSEQNLYA